MKFLFSTIKFISSRHRVVSSIYLAWDVSVIIKSIPPLPVWMSMILFLPTVLSNQISLHFFTDNCLNQSGFLTVLLLTDVNFDWRLRLNNTFRKSILKVCWRRHFDVWLMSLSSQRVNDKKWICWLQTNLSLWLETNVTAQNPYQGSEVVQKEPLSHDTQREKTLRPNVTWLPKYKAEPMFFPCPCRFNSWLSPNYFKEMLSLLQYNI